ncbi:hypothetical protein, partial [Massilia mucilaginosa]|uniref:hypothetical protein n=1 Tax=Massilia mucilaginosa TaxID=2609282 RepID=UPI001CB6F54A
LVGLGKLGKVGTRELVCHAAMMNEASGVYNMYISSSLRLNSYVFDCCRKTPLIIFAEIFDGGNVMIIFAFIDIRCFRVRKH